MSEDETFYICETCGARVESSDPKVVYAFELQPVDRMGGREYLEGMGALFHERYRRAPKPENF